MFQASLVRLQSLLRQVGLGRVVALAEDTCYAAVLIHHRLVNEVEDPLDLRAVEVGAQPHPDLPGHPPFPCGIDLVKPLEEPLACKFRKNLPNRATNVITRAKQSDVRVVHKLEHMVWLA